jgi:hypothetical protein
MKLLITPCVMRLKILQQKKTITSFIYIIIIHAHSEFNNISIRL